MAISLWLKSCPDLSAPFLLLCFSSGHQTDWSRKTDVLCGRSVQHSEERPGRKSQFSSYFHMSGKGPWKARNPDSSRQVPQHVPLFSIPLGFFAPNWCAHLVRTNFSWAELGLRARSRPQRCWLETAVNNYTRQSDGTRAKTNRKLSQDKKLTNGVLELKRNWLLS